MGSILSRSGKSTPKNNEQLPFLPYVAIPQDEGNTQCRCESHMYQRKTVWQRKVDALKSVQNDRK